MDTRDCIYNIPCECGRVYIGETSRPLSTRIKEHKYNFKQCLIDKSRIVQHSFESGHKIKWENTSILQTERSLTQRKYKEAAHMSFSDNAISQPSLILPDIWLPIIEQDIRNIQYKGKNTGTTAS